MRKRIKSFFGIVLGIQLIIAVSVIVLISLIVSHCNRTLEKEGSTFIEQIGKETKQIKNEFNKGFNADTLVIDTLEIK
jgi:hypothetical protein